MKRVQSYGGGVQSVTMLHMALKGEIEKPDLVLFGDTAAEPKAVYDVVMRDRQLAERAGIEFQIVRYGDLANQPFKAIHVPLYTLSLYDQVIEKQVWIDPNGVTYDADEFLVLTDAFDEVYEFPDAPGWREETVEVNIAAGKEGQLFRTCTDRFKIAPIRRELRQRGWNTERVQLWLGMTTDEIQRVKPSQTGWIDHAWPLLDKDMRRADCESFLFRNGIEAAKSACVFCPYRSASSWLTIKRSPADWAAAVAYDERIRHARPGFLCFVHSSRKPLVEAVDDRQLDLSDLWGGECSGFCAA